jgi:hypothetical protein
MCGRRLWGWASSAAAGAFVFGFVASTSPFAAWTRRLAVAVGLRRAVSPGARVGDRRFHSAPASVIVDVFAPPAGAFILTPERRFRGPGGLCILPLETLP